MDEDSRKNESKDKLLLQFDQELIYLSTYIVKYMLDKDGVEVVVIIFGYEVKKLVKYKYKFCKILSDSGHANLRENSYPYQLSKSGFECFKIILNFRLYP